MNFKTVGRASLALCIVCLFWLCAMPVSAQETADIVGTVTDASGAVVPGATVTLTNIGTNVTQTAVTQGTGDYQFTLLQVGTYSVKIEAKGFKSFTNSSIALSSGDRARIDAKLEVGDVAQTVEVSGTVAPAMQTDSSQVGSLVPSQTVEALPLNGRNLIQLVQLQPGVTAGSPGSIVQGNRPDDRRQISSFSVNGQVDTMNNNMIDGLDNNERIIGTIGVRPSLDAVQEVNVQTNKYDASVGRTGGGVVDVISKSGSNEYHGSAYEFLRNKVLNTNPNYNFKLADNPAGDTATGFNGCATVAACPAAPNPAFRQNQYGGSLGGPIKKDKMFFFGDYEGFKYATSLAAASYSVPTLCERGLNLAKLQGFAGASTPCPDGTSPANPGDFSDVVPISPVGGGARPAAGTLGPNLSNLPTCTTVSTATAGTCIAPMGLAYMSMYPLPNTGTASTLVNNYISSPTKTQTSDTWDARYDWHISDKNTFYARFTHNGETTANPNGFPAVHINPATGLPSSGGLLVNPVVLSYAGPNLETQEQFGTSFVHVYNPNLILNLKLGVFRSAIDSEPINELSDVSNKLWGGLCNPTSCINAEGLVPSVVGSGLASISLSSINGGNTLTGIGDTSFIPLREYDTAFQYLGILTWNKGSHSVRFGLGFIRRRATIGQSNNPQGTFTFSGTYTGVAAGDLLEGLAITESRNNALDQPGFRTWEPAVYVQDDWHARPWLTLNLGVRYDIFTPFTEVHGRLSNYDPYLGLLVSPAIPGIQQSGPSAMVPTPMRDIAPRFGFAATLPHEAVLRGGFGLTYFPVNYESPYYMKNAPFGFSESCNIQNTGGTVSPTCGTAQYGSGPVGQFNNGVTSSYGLAASNTSSTVGQTGGDLMGAGLPVPALNIALATNPANYKANGTIAAIPINLRENYLEQFNLELQKQYGANVLTLGWVGQIGRDVAPLNSATNQNLPANPSENKAGGATLPMVVGGDSYMFGQLPGFPYFNSTSTGVSEEANIGTSFYNAMQATFVRRFNKGLTVNLGYTWSHMLDNTDGSRACVLSVFASPEPCFYDLSKGTGPGLPAPAAATQQDCTNNASTCQNVFGWQRGDWGNGAQDVRHRISWGINYQLPFAKSATGVEGALLKGWGTNLGGSWQTGLPFNVTPATSTTNISGSGYLDQVCSGKAANPTILQWFNVSCFNHPQTSTLGKMEPNQLFGPSQKNLAFSLVKQFRLTERVNMEFRTEVFNLFNTAALNTPAGTSLAYGANNQTVNITGTSTPAGEITAMNANWSQREIQFALRFTF